MKILFKAIGTGIFQFFACIFFIAVTDNMSAILIDFWETDIKGWWYEAVVNKTLEYVAATALLSAVICLVWQSGCRYGRTIKEVTLILLGGELVLAAANALYWNYIERNCFPMEWSSLEFAYSESFGSSQFAELFFLILLCVIFAAGIILNHLGVFFKDIVKKETADQIFKGNRIFPEILYTEIPLCIVLTGVNFVVGLLQFPVAETFTVVVVSMILGYIFISAYHFRKISQYYRTILTDTDKKRYLVIVREDIALSRSFLYERFWRKKYYIEKLKKENIYLLPWNLTDINNKMCIMLDVYNEKTLEKELKDKEKFEKSRLQERGTFNIVYCENREILQKYDHLYDRSASDMETAAKDIIELKKFLKYRERQQEIISNLQTDKLTATNCIVDEIIAFKRYFDKNVNRFLVFDHEIKWLETINYLYTLIAISHQGTPLSRKVRKQIEMADFKKWIDMRKDIVYDQDIDKILSQPHDRNAVFQSFNRIWKAVTARDFAFSEYSVGELLRASKELRNYTRGHGVFTFEISDEINLNLIEILVFLINQLIVNGQLMGDFSNLEELGWMIYSGDTPYFLYSYNKTYREYCFNSFQNNSSIMLPANIRSQKDE